jgi:tRNA A37 methylthiotransferase MiaB
MEDIIAEAISHKADVYAFNSYMWSWSVVKVVAKRVKEALPNSVILLGGPHQGTTYSDTMFWFKKYPYFDAACQPTEFGEWFIMDVLDQLAQSDTIEWNNVRNSYHRKGKGSIENKLLFRFPSKVIESNLDEALKYTQVSKEQNKNLVVIYETTRGCPYGCTYCEWGGGINSKVVDKPIDDIENDLIYFPLLNVRSLLIVDANFGIMKTDVAKANMFAGLGGNPSQPIDVLTCGVAKSTAAKQRAVLDPLIASGVMPTYNMSVQTLNQDALKNIDRTDISVQEKLKIAKEYIEKYNINVTVEFIIGLPGETIDTFYQQFDVLYEVCNEYAGHSRAPFFVLPDSPGADRKYLEKFKMRIVPIGMETEHGEVQASLGADYIAIYDQEYVSDNVVYIPVESYSYTVDDWKEMIFMTEIDQQFVNQLLLRPFVEFLMYHRNTKPSTTIRKMFAVLKNIPSFYSYFDQYLETIASGNCADKDWRLIIIDDWEDNIFRGDLMLWERNRSQIFKGIRQEFSDIMDSTTSDLLTYMENSTFRVSGEIEWTSEWDWAAWEDQSDRAQLPNQTKTKFKTTGVAVDWSKVNLNFKRNIHTQKIGS